MANSIFATRTEVYMLQSGGGGSGRFSLEGFESVFKTGKGEPPVMITGISYGENDVILPVVALDDKRILYTFGKNFGQFSLHGTIYLCGCQQDTMKIQKLMSTFESERVSKAKKPINFSTGDYSAKVYPQEITLQNGNPNRQSIDFSITCLVAPVENKG